MDQLSNSAPTTSRFVPIVNDQRRIDQLEREVQHLNRQIKVLKNDNRRLRNQSGSAIGLPCSLTFLEYLAKTLPQCIVQAFDKNLRYFYAGGEGLDLIAVQPHHFIGKTIREMDIADDGTADFFEPLFHATLNGQYREYEYHTKKKHIYQGVIFPLIDANGQIVAGLVICSEAVTQSQAERELMELAVLEERQRIAQELHDVVSQTLFTVNMIADVLPKLWQRSPDSASEKLMLMRHNTQLAFTQMRTLLYELKPESLEEIALPELIEQLVTTMKSRTEMSIKLNIDFDREWFKLPDQVKIALYRIVQEGMNNAIQHARASFLLIQIRCEPLLNQVAICLTDNGKGFDPDGNFPGHLGIKIMRDRADKAGVLISIQSEIGCGTEIQAIWIDRDPTNPIGEKYLAANSHSSL